MMNIFFLSIVGNWFNSGQINQSINKCKLVNCVSVGATKSLAVADWVLPVLPFDTQHPRKSK